MRYVILILALLIGLPSIATATVPPEVESLCDSDCASYSTDLECDADGACAETYAQCYARCVLPGGSTAPALSSSTIGIASCQVGFAWMEDYVIREGGRWLHRKRWVFLDRCGALHWLTFGEWRTSQISPL